MHNEFIQKYADYHEIPYEKAEADIVEAVTEVARVISPKFRFGYHDVEDMVQQSFIEAFEAFNKGDYDMTRPLRPYLKVHLHNRLYNYKRNNFFRMEIPCRCCEVDTTTPCLRYSKWLKKNSLKKGLVMPCSLEIEPISPSPNLDEDADMKELKGSIPDELKPSLMRVLNGQSITSANKARLGAYLADRFEEDEG